LANAGVDLDYVTTGRERLAGAPPVAFDDEKVVLIVEVAVLEEEADAARGPPKA